MTTTTAEEPQIGMNDHTLEDEGLLALAEDRYKTNNSKKAVNAKFKASDTAFRDALDNVVIDGQTLNAYLEADEERVVHVGPFKITGKRTDDADIAFTRRGGFKRSITENSGG